MSRVLRLGSGAAVALTLTLLAPFAAAQGQEETVEQRMIGARRMIDVANFDGALQVLNEVIRAVNASQTPQTERRTILTEAYLHRGRALFGVNDPERALDDFRQLLFLTPTQKLDTPLPALRTLFEQAQKSVVGTVVLRVTPDDSDVVVDGKRMSDLATPLMLAAGPHTLSVSRKSFAPMQQELNIVAGETFERAVALDRVSSTLRIVSIPDGVEVILDKVSKGITPPGPPPAEWIPSLTQAGATPDRASGVFEVDGLASASYLLTFRKACYVPVENTLSAVEMRDINLTPVRLTRAVGTVRVSGDEGHVFLDGEDKGTGRALGDVCEGTRRVEVRSDLGRYVEVIDVKRGQEHAINAQVRPAVAVLAVAGLPEDYRGPDAKDRLATELAKSALTVFTPPRDQIDPALKRTQVADGWLAKPSTAFTDEARLEVSRGLSTALGVQAVAEVNVPATGDYSNVELVLLASGSARPDILPVRLDNRTSLNDLMRRLEALPALTNNSIGVDVVDVYDGAGKVTAVVVAVEPNGVAAKAGVAPGDGLLRVNGQDAGDASALSTAIAAAKEGDAIALELRDSNEQNPVAKRVSVSVAARPAVIGFADQTLIPNRLILEFRRRIPRAASPAEEAVLRLNLAVALMKVGNWFDAEAELKRVTLPAAPGVSAGTVQYLLGQVYRRLGRPTEEAAAFEAARNSAGARLTVGGPLVSELVRAEREAATRR